MNLCIWFISFYSIYTALTMSGWFESVSTRLISFSCLIAMIDNVVHVQSVVETHLHKCEDSFDTCSLKGGFVSL